MDIPNPPEEPEVKNIIDKLANFVARNGIEFEKMTKDKQKGNPKFSFLFGGDHYAYYQYKLKSEQQMYGQKQAHENVVQQSLQNAPWQQQPGNQPPPIPPLMPPFPPRFPPQMQGRMPMPPWQQNQQMPPAQPQPNMNMQQRFMPPPPNAGQNMPPQMGQHPPPPQMFQGGSNQQMGPPPNFNMYRQPPPNLPPQRPPFQFQGDPRPQLPPQFNQGPENLGEPPQNEDFMRHQAPQSSNEDHQAVDIDKEEEEARRKIEESENNLKQQFEVLMKQQEEKIEIAIVQAQETKLRDLASSTGVMTSEFGSILQPIINTCTKDAISAGKTWILNNAKTMDHCKVIALYLRKRVVDTEKLPANELPGKSKFNAQLHIVYLINDVLHHASRKNLEDLSTALQSVILPIFCLANANASQDEKDRLTKLLGLWQKFKYFNEGLLQRLKDPSSAMSEYQAGLIIEHANEVKQVQTDIQNQYEQYQKQHDEYAAHILKKVEDKKEELEKKNERKHMEKDNAKGPDGGNVPPWASTYNEQQQRSFDYGNEASNRPPQVIDYSHSRDPSEWQDGEFGPRPPWNQGPRGMAPPWQDSPPWGPRAPAPRGPRPINPNDPALVPTVPYYDLPAGLMCPLVKLEESEYKPLDPAMIRLPAPMPPSDRLLAAVEAFYAPPSHERPRNVDGWERNGLFEFYRAKVRAKRGTDGNFSRSKSRSRSRSRSRSKSYSKSESSRSRSRSRSSKSSRSRSRSRSRSPRRRSRSPDKDRRSRSRSRDRIGRSPTPPMRGGLFSRQDPDGRLGEENRGAQLLKKMGWSGAGLGAKEQGREDPVAHGEIRDKYDQFKGLGMPTDDPYESFRKSKSQGFITRMKARDKERERDKDRRGRKDDVQ